MREKVIKKILMIFGAAVCWALLLAGTAFAVDLPEGFDAPDNGIPVVYIIIDESEEGIAAAQAADKDGYTYGTIEQMNDSEDHDMYCTGTVDIVVPEGFTGYWSETPFESLQGLKLEHIRGRGNSTWVSEKKPYKLKFKDKQDLFNMGESKTWAMMANESDRTLLYNTFTYELGRRMGLEFCPQGIPVDFVMLGVDGGECRSCEYLGSYVLSETVKVEPSRVAIDELGKNVTKTQEEASEGEANISGGYLMSVYNINQDEDTPPAQVFTSDHGVKLIYEEPEFKSEQTEGRDVQQNYIKNYLQQLEDLIMAEGEIDQTRHDQIAEMMDLESAANYWWIQELSQNGDGFATHSTYLYKKRNGKLYWGPLWDFDLAWGDNVKEIETDEIRADFNTTEMLWLDQLRQRDQQFAQLLKDRWEDTLEDGGMKAVLLDMLAEGGQLDQYANELAASWVYNRNAIADDYWRELEYEDEIDGFREWVTTSIDWVDAHIDEVGTVYVPVHFIADGEEVAVAQTRIGNVVKVPKEPQKKSYVFEGWFDEKGEQAGMNVIRAEQSYYARYVPENEAVMPTELDIWRDEEWIPLKDTLYMPPTVVTVPEEITDQRIDWVSSNPEVAEYNGTWFDLNGTGTAVLTASCHNGVSASMILHVYDSTQETAVVPTGVKPEANAYQIARGERKKFRYTLLPENVPLTFQYMSYTSSNKDVATISEAGYIEGISDGTATVTVNIIDTDDNICCTGTCKVVVGANADTKPVVKKTNPFTAKGRKVTLKARKLRKRKQVVARKKAIKITKKKGRLTYKLLKVSKKKYRKRFRVNFKTGKITVKKRTRRGLYKLRIRVTDAGNADYKERSRTVTVKIRVK